MRRIIFEIQSNKIKKRISSISKKFLALRFLRTTLQYKTSQLFPIIVWSATQHTESFHIKQILRISLHCKVDWKSIPQRMLAAASRAHPIGAVNPFSHFIHAISQVVSYVRRALQSIFYISSFNFALLQSCHRKMTPGLARFSRVSVSRFSATKLEANLRNKQTNLSESSTNMNPKWL